MGRNAPIFDKSHFSLGFFSPNCDGGNTIATVPERWVATWDSLTKLTVAADEAGLDFMLPIWRFRGWDGSSAFQKNGLDTLIYSAAMAPITKRIVLFSTLNITTMNPAVVAKQITNIDHLSKGRAGINIVCGWNPREQHLFGIPALSHDELYVYGEEWVNIAKLVWAGGDKPTSFKGKYFDAWDLNEVQGPAPYSGNPILLNAAQSPIGQAFATRNCDFLLHASVDLELSRVTVPAMKAEMRQKYGKELNIMTTAHIICRPTETEALDYRQYVLDHADIESTDGLMSALLGANKNAVLNMNLPLDATEAEIKVNYIRQRDRWTLGHGTFGPITGTPDQVADTICKMKDVGYSGLAFSFVNYLNELPYFQQEVMPRLEARGLRRAVG